MPFQKPVLGNVRAKILLLGEPGAGKTYGALTFPRPAVIDAEGSVDLFADEFDFVSQPTKSLKKAIELAREVAAGKIMVSEKPCETLIIDSLTSLYNTVQAAAMGANGDIDMQKWGLIKRLNSTLLDVLYEKVDTHVICTAWIKPKFTGADKKTGELLADGEVMDGDRKSSYAFDLIFKLRVDPRNGKRSVLVMKARGAFGKHWKAGQVIEKPFSYELLEPILGQFKGREKRRGNQTEEEAALIDKRALENSREIDQENDHTYQLRYAMTAYRAFDPGQNDNAAIGTAIIEAIIEQFELSLRPRNSSELTPQQLKWAGDHFAKLAKSAT